MYAISFSMDNVKLWTMQCNSCWTLCGSRRQASGVRYGTCSIFYETQTVASVQASPPPSLRWCEGSPGALDAALDTFRAQSPAPWVKCERSGEIGRVLSIIILVRELMHASCQLVYRIHLAALLCRSPLGGVLLPVIKLDWGERAPSMCGMPEYGLSPE